MKRKAVVAGQFYDRNIKNLKNTIKNCFLDEKGPGKIPSIVTSKKRVMGLVVPHAGYIYSGFVAAHSYFFLSQRGFGKTFIIIGPNHTGTGSGVSIMTEGEWSTPFGNVSINEELANKLWTGIIDRDTTAHLYEHSIEVQLPFLQYIAGKNMFDFVPICMAMQEFETSEEVGTIIYNSIKDENNDIIIIASSDFSHTGFSYMSMPPNSERVDIFSKKKDSLAIDKILNLDAMGLIDTVHLNNISMCGYGPIASMIVSCKLLGAKHAKLLRYSSSYEVQPGNSCVGYGAIAVY